MSYTLNDRQLLSTITVNVRLCVCVCNVCVIPPPNRTRWHSRWTETESEEIPLVNVFQPILILHTHTRTHRLTIIHTNTSTTITWTHEHARTFESSPQWHLADSQGWLKRWKWHFHRKSADASFRAEDVKDESLKLIKKSPSEELRVHSWIPKKKKSLEKPAGCNLWP